MAAISSLFRPIASNAAQASDPQPVRHAVITGGSSGIGLAFAQRLAADGTRLTLLARDATKLEDAAHGLQTSHPTFPVVFVRPTDVSNRAEVEAAIDAAVETHGPVDLLITSAGIAEAGTFEDTAAETFERMMAVNYLGTVYALKKVLPAMRARGQGRVILISSGTGLFGIFGYSAYGASKFALRGLAESLAAEYRSSGVDIHIAYPPDTDTPQLAHENRSKPAETKAITAGGGLWLADAVAAHVLKKAEAGRFSITPGLPLTALSWLHSAIAPLLRWHFHRVARRAATSQR